MASVRRSPPTAKTLGGAPGPAPPRPLRHGLAIPLARDPVASAEIDRLAAALIGTCRASDQRSEPLAFNGKQEAAAVPELQALERYERRAVSRRKRAMRWLIYAIVHNQWRGLAKQTQCPHEGARPSARFAVPAASPGHLDRDRAAADAERDCPSLPELSLERSEAVDREGAPWAFDGTRPEFRQDIVSRANCEQELHPQGGGANASRDVAISFLRLANLDGESCSTSRISRSPRRRCSSAHEAQARERCAMRLHNDLNPAPARSCG
jgi:hypothetical protein